MDVDLVIKQVRISDSRPLVDICIKSGKIALLGENLSVNSPQVVDASGRVILPGFVEPHLHLDKALLHGRIPASDGTLDEAIRITGILKARQDREDVLERSRRVLDMAVHNGTTAIRAHSDVDPIQGLIGVETLLELREEYRNLLDLQIVAFPQEGILKSPGTYQLMAEAMSMGADVVGGCPYCEKGWDEARQHIDMVFDMAQRFSASMDMHADFSDEANDPRFASSAYIAGKTIELGYQGRVSLGHVTSLGSLDPEQLKPIVELLQRADISVITLPATDLYLSGRKDLKNQRRGLTPVGFLQAAGVNVAYSSNNIRNAFTPFGKADMLLIGNMLAHVIQFGTDAQQAAVLDMGTWNAAHSIGIAADYGIKVGKTADLVILDTYRVADALLDIPSRSWVIKRGRITVVTHHDSKILRHQNDQTHAL